MVTKQYGCAGSFRLTYVKTIKRVQYSLLLRL